MKLSSLNKDEKRPKINNHSGSKWSTREKLVTKRFIGFKKAYGCFKFLENLEFIQRYACQNNE